MISPYFIINALEKLEGEKRKLTVEQYLDLLKDLRNKQKALDDERDAEIENTYKNKFIMTDFSGVFGKEIRVYQVDKIKACGHDVDMERLFRINGPTIMISENSVPRVNVGSNDTEYSQLGISMLESMKFITENEFNTYKESAESIINQINNLITE